MTKQNVQQIIHTYRIPDEEASELLSMAVKYDNIVRAIESWSVGHNRSFEYLQIIEGIIHDE